MRLGKYYFLLRIWEGGDGIVCLGMCGLAVAIYYLLKS